MKAKMYYHPSPDEAYMEGFGENREKKKEQRKISTEMSYAMGRILQEMWKLLPRQATVFQLVTVKKKDKWDSEFAIYMTKDPNHEKPKKESEFAKTFNISKEQMNHLRDVINRSLRYVWEHTAIEKYGVDVVILTLYYDGSARYRFGQLQKSSVSNITHEMAVNVSSLGTRKGPAMIDGEGMLGDDFDNLI
jgi:uncharacterized protein YifN (PemK superfamily)